MKSSLGSTEQIAFWKRLLLRQQDPGPIGSGEARVRSVPRFENWNHVENSKALHVFRMIQGHTVGDAPSAIVTDQREDRKVEFDHDVNEFLCHGALGIRKVVVCGSGYSAAPVSAQVHANHSVILGKLRREESPH